MKWNELLKIVGDDPVFDSSVLLAGSEKPASLRQQLSRWVKSGRLVQLRRSIYALSDPYRKAAPHPFLVANRLNTPSYVSLQSALNYYGMIPEYVPATTSITTGRPEEVNTELGDFIFHHVKKEMFFGYVQTEIAPDQPAFLAHREKALLDLIYLTPGSDNPAYLEELRLDLSSEFQWERIESYQDRLNSPKLKRAIKNLKEIT